MELRTHGTAMQTAMLPFASDTLYLKVQRNDSLELDFHDINITTNRKPQLLLCVQ